MMAEKHEHVFIEDGDYVHAAGECEICGLHYRDYIKQLRAREAEWDSKEQALQKSIAEHGRVIAKIEALYEEQGQYNHELVRRLADAMEIVKATAQRGVTVYDSTGASHGNAFLSVEIVTKARALLAEGEGQ